ncbi:MAG: hypothetical protein DWI21_09930 [Planctomycetota bacterium]|nr:MAG: hypothetical protein DWI21_09930 [Planctomycetota bacterium]
MRCLDIIRRSDRQKQAGSGRNGDVSADLCRQKRFDGLPRRIVRMQHQQSPLDSTDIRNETGQTSSSDKFASRVCRSGLCFTRLPKDG